MNWIINIYIIVHYSKSEWISVEICADMYAHHKLRIYFYCRSNNCAYIMYIQLQAHIFDPLYEKMHLWAECNTCFPYFSQTPTVLVVYICYISKNNTNWYVSPAERNLTGFGQIILPIINISKHCLQISVSFFKS